MKKFFKENEMIRRAFAFFMAAVMFMGYLPVTTRAETEPNPGEITTVSDPATLTRPEAIYGSNTLNAGKVTVGKSVSDKSVSIEYADNKSQTFTPAENSFIVTMSQTAQVMGLTSEMSVPVDVVFVLDTTGSMSAEVIAANGKGTGKNRSETVVDVVNDAISQLMEANQYNRVGVVAFSAYNAGGVDAGGNAASVLSGLSHYTGDAASKHLTWDTRNGQGPSWSVNAPLIRGRNANGTVGKGRAGYHGATNIQAGLATGAKLLMAADTTLNIDGHTVTRMPFLILLSDGAPVASSSNNDWTNPSMTLTQGPNGNPLMVGNSFLPILTATYYKQQITNHYYPDSNGSMSIYTMGFAVADSEKDMSAMTLNPAEELTNESNDWHDQIEAAWNSYASNTDFSIDVGKPAELKSGYSHDGKYYFYSKRTQVDISKVNDIQDDTVSKTAEQFYGVSGNNAKVTFEDNIFESIVPADKSIRALAYNDDYFDVNDADALEGAFDSIMTQINKKALSSPTHVGTEGDHNFEGYVTFTDPIGEYMEVKNVRGILANGHMHPGADFARMLKSGDSAFVSSLKNVLKKRMSINGITATDEFLNDFIAKALNSENQANYISDSNYDNSIVWWGKEYDSGEEDKGVQLLGFADNDTIEYIESQTNENGAVMVNGVAADYVCRSYFFYCTEDTSHEFMYLMVRIQRELKAPYAETVVVSCPASLLSVDEVLINEKTENGAVKYTADVKDEYPLRVIYEVGLRGDINAQNVDSIVTDAYRTEKPADNAGSVNYDPTTGTYSFFTNDWDRNENAGSHHRAMAKATFDAAADNSFYTYQEDTLLLDKNGNAYTGNLSAGLELYYEREFFKWTGEGSGSYTATKDTQLIKVLIPDDYSSVIKQVDGKWYISKGVYTASTLEVTGDDTVKADNNTGTSTIVSHAHRTGSSTNSHYTVLLGNNGKLTLVREPAKSVFINNSATNDDGKTVMVGDTLTYSIKVSNADAEAVTANVTDKVPAGTAYVEGSAAVKDEAGKAVEADFSNENGSLTWSDIPVPAKGYVTVSFQVTVTTEALSGANDVVNIDNAATIKLGNNPAYTTNKVTNPPEGKKVVDLTGEDIDGETVKVGDVLVYRIRVQSDAVDSNGTPIKSDIVVTDVIPSGTTFKSASHGGVHENGTVTWSFTGENQLAADASVVLTMEVYVDASAKVSPESGKIELPNQATITVGTNDPKVVRTTNEVINYAEVGNISITKAFAEGTDGFDTKVFNLALTETGYKLNGSYDLYVDGEKADDPIVFTDGIAAATIKNGQVITIKGIPMGATIMVAETLTAAGDPGWSVSGVTPTSGTYTVDSADETVDVTITNRYTAAPVEFQLKGTKTVDDDNFPDGTFTFQATQVNFNESTKKVTDIEGGRQIFANATVTNGQNAAFVFSPRVFTEEATLYYIIEEAASTIKGVQTDNTKYLMKLVIADDHAQLKATAYIQSSTTGEWKAFTDAMEFQWLNNEEQVVFRNTYTPASTDVTISGNKTLTGRTQTAGEFSFQLVDVAAGVVVATANNAANGDFSFAPLTFTEEDIGTISYAVREAKGPDANVSYDDTYYLIEITVYDDNGQLKTSQKITKYVSTNGAYGTGTAADKVVYTNTYHTQDVSVSFDGQKKLSGAAANGLKAEDFTFKIVEATVAGDIWTATDKIVSSGANEDETAKNVAPVTFADITYSVELFENVEAVGGIKTLNFYYIAKEIIPAKTEPSFDVNMKYDKTEYRIQVQLTLDTATGLMEAEILKVNGQDVNADSFDKLNFENIKNPATVSFDPTGKKTTNTTADKLPDGLRFSFRVTTLDGATVVGTGLSQAGEKGQKVDIEFTNMEYDHEDVGNTYLYLVEETLKTPVTGTPDIIYDATRYVLAVSVSRGADKELVATGKYYSIPEGTVLSDVTADNYETKLAEVNGDITFTNTFNVAKTLNITATKQQTGERELNARDYDFRFELLKKAEGDKFATTGVVVDGRNEADNDQDGTAAVTFGTMLFTSDQLIDSRLVSAPEGGGDGDYVYHYHALMSEIEPEGVKHAGVTYDQSKYIVVLEWVVTYTTVEGVRTPSYGEPVLKGVYKAVADGNAYTIGDAVKTVFAEKDADTGVTFVNAYTTKTGTAATMTASKVLNGAERILKDNEFSFELHRWYKDASDDSIRSVLVETATNKSGAVTFTRNYPATISADFFTDDVAIFIYQIKETKGSIPGITYSDDEYWVEVIITHDQDTASLVLNSVKYYSQCNKETLELSGEITASDAVFTNTYSVKEASYAPQVNKELLHLRDGQWVNDLTGYDKAFSFELVETDDKGNVIYINSAGQVVDKDAEGAYAKVIAAANNDTSGTVTFAAVPYTAAGTYYYMIREAQGTDPNVDYTDKVVYLRVIVEDIESILTTSVEYGSYTEGTFTENKDAGFTTFTNHYGPHLLNLELDLEKNVVTSIEGANYRLQESEFEFGIYKANADGTKGDYVTSGTNNAEGKIVFGTIQITQADFDSADTDDNGVAEFKFVVEEYGAGVPGITVDVPMTVTVTVEDKGYGNLVQTGVTYEQQDPIAGAADDNKFTNKYDATPVKVKLNAHKVLIGKVLKDNEFHFVLSSVKDGVVTVLKDDITVVNGVVEIPEITFAAPGTYTYTFAEKTLADHPNYSFDDTVYTIHVVVTDDGKGQLHAVTTIYKNFDASEGASNEPVGGMSFTNTYTPSDIEKDLTVQINAEKLIVDAEGNKLDNKSLAGYTFKVEDANGNPVKGKDGKEITGISGADGKITFAPAFHFTAEGEYHYYISEIDTGKPGYVYDSNIWALHILVRYNPGPNPVEYISGGETVVAKNGELYIADADVSCALKTAAAEMDDTSDAARSVPGVQFVNVYNPEQTSINLVVTKVMTGKDMKAGEFKFHLMRKDAEGNYSIIVSEATNDAGGNVNFRITYKLSDLVDDEGKRLNSRIFDYQIHEDVPEEAVNGVLNGVTYDKSIKNIQIKVTDENGKIRAYSGDEEIKNTHSTGVVFTNAYQAASVKVPVQATKILTGSDSMLIFSFELVDSEGNVIQTVNNDLDGLITFAPLTFEQKDLDGQIQKTFVYTLREKAGSLAAVTYDSTVYTVTVTVTDNLVGNLQYTVTYSNEDGQVSPVFNNSYDPDVNDTVATIQATKKLTGKNLTAGAFTFELVDEDGKILEAKNDSKGNITFNVAYTEAGTYTYTIREKAGTDESMSYDSKTYQVEVEVTAGEDGRLNAKVTYKTDSGNAPIFRNTYTPSATKITLEGTKELTGRDMTAGEFKFEVHDSKGNLVATGKNTAKGKINFTEIKLPQAGTYRLTVSEVDSKADNITYDTTEFKVVVVVKNDNGVLKAEVTYEKDIKFVNVYTPEPTEPPTEPPTEKPTEPPTEKPTEPPTEPPTEKPTEPPTEPPTEKPTEPPTEPPTEKPTEPPTEPPTEKPTEPPTEPPTEKPTEPPTEPPTEKPTEPPTEPPTQKPTEPSKVPDTGDRSAIGGHTLLLMISLLGIFVVLLMMKSSTKGKYVR